MISLSVTHRYNIIINIQKQVLIIIYGYYEILILKSEVNLWAILLNMMHNNELLIYDNIEIIKKQQ